jgi:hypothetical protein
LAPEDDDLVAEHGVLEEQIVAGANRVNKRGGQLRGRGERFGSTIG